MPENKVPESAEVRAERRLRDALPKRIGEFLGDKLDAASAAIDRGPNGMFKAVLVLMAVGMIGHGCMEVLYFVAGKGERK